MSEGRPQGLSVGEFWFLLALLVAAHVVLQVLKGGWGFLDGDSWLHALRVRDLLEGQGWFDARVHRANFPDGFVPHWTRLFDLLLLIPTLPLVPFVGADKAVQAVGMIIGPALHAATLLALAWATEPLLGRRATFLAALLAIFPSAILEATAPGAVDHHGLILLLAALFLGWGVRVLEEGAGTVWLGLVVALSLWAAAEMLVPLFAFLAAVATLHGGGDSLAAHRATSVLKVACAAAVPLLLIERGGAAFGAAEFDRLSILHIGLLLSMVLAMAGLQGAGIRSSGGAVPARRRGSFDSGWRGPGGHGGGRRG